MNHARKERLRLKAFLQRYLLILFGSAFCAFGYPVLFSAIWAICRVGFTADTVSGLFIGLLFGGTGSAVVLLGIHVARQFSQQDHDRQAWPDQPWNRRRDWRERLVLPDAWLGPCVFIGFAGFWNLMSWGMLLVGISRADLPSGALYFLGCFCVIGIGLAAQAIWYVIEARKASHCRLELGDCPTGLGQPFVAKAKIPDRVREGESATLTLACRAPKHYQRTTRGSSSRITEVWSAERTVRSFLPQAEFGTTVVPVCFEIPEDAPGSDSDEGTRWTLSAKIPGGFRSYAVEFEVPIFQLKEQSVSEATRQAAMRYSQCLTEPTFNELVCRRRGKVLCDSPERVDLLFGGAGPLGVLITLAGGSLIATMIWMLFGAAASWLLVAAILIVGAATLETLASTRIVADGTHLRIHRAVFGIGRKRVFRWSDIDSVEATLEPEPGEHGTSMCVRLRTHEDKWHTLLDRTPQHIISAAVADRLNEHRSRHGEATP